MARPPSLQRCGQSCRAVALPLVVDSTACIPELAVAIRHGATVTPISEVNDTPPMCMTATIKAAMWSFPSAIPSASMGAQPIALQHSTKLSTRSPFDTWWKGW